MTFIIFISVILCIVTPHIIYILPCSIVIDLLLLFLHHKYSYDALINRFGQIQYSTIREMIFFIDRDLPDYSNSIATQYNIKIRKISKLAQMLTFDDSAFIVEMFELSPDTIPIVINIRREDLSKLIEQKGPIYDGKVSNDQFLNLTNTIKNIMERGNKYDNSNSSSDNTEIYQGR